MRPVGELNRGGLNTEAASQQLPQHRATDHEAAARFVELEPVGACQFIAGKNASQRLDLMRGPIQVQPHDIDDITAQCEWRGHQWPGGVVHVTEFFFVAAES